MRLILVLFIHSLLYAQSEFGTSKSSTKTIGVLYWSNTIQGQVAMKAGLEKRFTELKNAQKIVNPNSEYKLIGLLAGDGPDSVEKQIKQFDELIDQKVDLIIVQPTNNAALVKGLKKANELKIPVVAYDQYIIDGKLTSYVTSNNYQAGYLNGEFIAAKFKHLSAQLLKIILVEYPFVSSTVERVNGFLDALNDHKINYKIIKTYQAVEPVKGKEVANSILNDFPIKNSFDVIFSINDGAGVTIAHSLLAANRTEIVMASIDGDPESVNLIKKNKIMAINSAQFCSEIGAKTIEVSFDILNGKKVASKILVPTFPITKETVNNYTGWFGAIPKGMEKPWKKNSFWNNNFKYIE